MKPFVIALVVVLNAPAAAWAQSESDWGESDWGETGGFADFDTTPVVAAPPEPSRWSIDGFARTDWGLWTERVDDGAAAAFAKGRQNLDLAFRYKADAFRVVVEGHGDYDLAYRADRDRFDEPTLDAYEWQARTGEAFAAGSLGRWELTVGRQIVAWGEGDLFSPLDVVNPRDVREPGLADLEDLRLPVLATRIGWFEGGHRLEVMLVHEADFGYKPPPMGELSALPGALAAGDAPFDPARLGDRDVAFDERPERFGAEATQVFARWVYKGPAIDVALYAASVLDRNGVVALPSLAELLTAERIEIPIAHRRTAVFGTSGALARGPWLLKWELGTTLDRPVNVDASEGGPVPAIETAQTPVVHTLFALGYSGFRDTQVQIEIGKDWLLDRPDALLVPVDTPTMAVRATRRFWRETLDVTAVGVFFGTAAARGWLARADVDYELRDGWRLGVGYITYQPGDEVGPIVGFDDHDRATVRLRWDFLLH